MSKKEKQRRPVGWAKGLGSMVDGQKRDSLGAASAPRFTTVRGCGAIRPCASQVVEVDCGAEIGWIGNSADGAVVGTKDGAILRIVCGEDGWVAVAQA